MSKGTVFVGMDVHAETIAVAVAEGREQARSLGTIANRPEAVRRVLGKLGKPGKLKVCYEAGPTGYALYWELTRMGIHCEVIAPSLVPTKAGERIKTDRRDAEKLARSYRSGDLTAVWVPDARHEALRDLVRAREAAKEDQLRAKHRLGKYLLRNGQRPAEGCRAWTAAWWQWVRGLELPYADQNTTLLDYIMQVDHQAQRIELLEGAIDRAVAAAPAELRALVDALQALRGVAKVTAVTLATEFGTFSRFERAAQVMSYTGVVPSEHSSGQRTRRSGITKTGNTHLRRVLVEAAWHYRHKPRICQRQHALQATLSPKVAAIAWRAQERLHRRYWALSQKSKPSGKIVTALARELVGFVWAIGVETEQHHRKQEAA
ncbi:MAG TPA: IS110 family transposase [Polyangiaceae bacterium]